MNNSVIQTTTIIAAVFMAAWVIRGDVAENAAAIAANAAAIAANAEAIAANAAAIKQLQNDMNKLHGEVNQIRSEMDKLSGALSAHISSHAHLPLIAQSQGDESAE